MDQQKIIADIEQRAHDERVSIRFLCQRAGVHPTTFSRWKRTENNPDPKGPNYKSIKRLWDALDDIAAENRRRRTRRGKAVAA